MYTPTDLLSPPLDDTEAAHERLMRVWALRQKRQAIDGAMTEGSWALHVAGRSSLIVVDPGARPRQAARPKSVSVAASAPHVHQGIKVKVS